MSAKGLLVDLTRCIGCRGCQAACKQWHDLPAETTHNRGSYQNPPALSARTWTVLTFHELARGDGGTRWVFAKRQCMHCQEPACVSACTVGALSKTADGPVAYDASKCISCRYCQYACPFGVPGYEWDQVLGLIGKCDFCADRQAAGLAPSCAQTCPTGALTFGDRADLLVAARERIAAAPERYQPRIYGEREVGGTSMLYLSAVPFGALGFPAVGDAPVARAAEAIVMQTPVVAAGVAVAATGLYWICRRREANRTTAEQGTSGEDRGEP